METPIGSWTVDPDFDANEREMVNKFHGYERERLHFPDVDKATIRSPKAIKRITDAFLKVPYKFHIYFWQGKNPDYDSYLQAGLVDPKWVINRMGQGVADKVFGNTGITIIMTNNLSDERYMSLKSPWIFGHRIAHAMVGALNDYNYRIIDFFEDFVIKVGKIGYGVKWNTWHDGIYREEIEVITRVLGHALGTMQSARKGHLVTPYEWYYETFTQYLLTGKITINPLPNALDEYHTLTTDLQKLKTVKRLWQRFPIVLTSLFDRLLKDSNGKVFVI